jgi:pilus assembly protein TadC
VTGAAAWLAAASAAAAVALLLPGRPRLRDRVERTRPPPVGWLHRHRLLWSVLAGAAAFLFLSGPAGAVGGVLAGAGTWLSVGRAEPADVRARRAAVRRDLPYVVALLAATLRSGVSPADGVAQVCAALPGPATDRLAGVAARLSLGLDPAQVWAGLAEDPQLAGLGRTLARAHETGAPVVAAVERLADELSRTQRSETEERARAVGVRAAVPLGLCLLPAFVLIGIVPLVVALLADLKL